MQFCTEQTHALFPYCGICFRYLFPRCVVHSLRKNCNSSLNKYNIPLLRPRMYRYVQYYFARNTFIGIIDAHSKSTYTCAVQFCLIDVAIVVAILKRNNTIPISGKRSNLEMLPDAVLVCNGNRVCVGGKPSGLRWFLKDWWLALVHIIR